MITNKQDRQGVRTPADIERKYNLGRMAKLLEQMESPEYSEKLIRMVLEAFGGCAGMNRRIVPLQLIAAGWETIGDNLHSQVVTIDGVNAYHKINLDLSPEQLLKNKNFLLTTKNEDGVVTVYAIGRKPQADLSIQATVTGTGSTAGNYCGSAGRCLGNHWRKTALPGCFPGVGEYLQPDRLGSKCGSASFLSEPGLFRYHLQR